MIILAEEGSTTECIVDVYREDRHSYMLKMNERRPSPEYICKANGNGTGDWVLPD